MWNDYTKFIIEGKIPEISRIILKSYEWNTNCVKKYILPSA